MNRRSFLFCAATVPIVALITGCGDPDQRPGATEPTSPITTPVTPAVIDHPTGADDVVLKLSYEGGLVPIGYDLASVPALLVSGDRRVFTAAPVPAIYPGPLLPAVAVRSITEDGIQALLGVAAGADLLQSPPDYSGGDQVADGASSVLTINAAGGTFVHSAYALGIVDPESPARQRLHDAINSLTDLETAAGAANLGADEAFVATSYRLMARAVDPSQLTGQDPAPTVVDWPTSAGVPLVDAATCARVDAVAIGSLFIDAKQNTYFKDNGIVYRVSVRGVLPGDPAC